jgi:HD-GYP domain-containing protein (c-di-GMP phosphodiesterase class II)
MRASTGQFDPQLLEAFLGWVETSDIPASRRPTPQRVATFTMGLQA